MRAPEVIALIIVIFSFLITIYYYPQFPAEVASHWNAAGEVDGYMSKFWGLFITPLISIAILLLLIGIPRIDPLKQNVKKFRTHYDRLIILVMAFLVYMHILIIYSNLGINFNMIQMLSPAIGILFYYLGSIMPNLKRNWFIGIRTPWTLSNDKVWDKTHKTGAKYFKISGIIAIVGILIPQYAIWLMIVPIILAVIYTLVYSYFAYQKEVKR
ncbi:MAG: SdpI family protein [Candidatus Aenigmatarchaeota archaeon]|nr:SdpI family protein [Nanoarchaeota archaeon]